MIKFPMRKVIFKGVQVDYSSSALDLSPVTVTSPLSLTLMEGTTVLERGYTSLWIGKSASVSISDPGTSESQKHVFDDIIFEDGRDNTAGLFDMAPRMVIYKSLVFPEGLEVLPTSQYQYHTILSLPEDRVGITEYSWIVKYPSTVTEINMSELLAWIPTYITEGVDAKVYAYFPHTSVPNISGIGTCVHCYVNRDIVSDFSARYGSLVAEIVPF